MPLEDWPELAHPMVPIGKLPFSYLAFAKRNNQAVMDRQARNAKLHQIPHRKLHRYALDPHEVCPAEASGRFGFPFRHGRVSLQSVVTDHPGRVLA